MNGHVEENLSHGQPSTHSPHVSNRFISASSHDELRQDRKSLRPEHINFARHTQNNNTAGGIHRHSKNTATRRPQPTGHSLLLHSKPALHFTDATQVNHSATQSEEKTHPLSPPTVRSSHTTNSPNTEPAETTQVRDHSQVGFSTFFLPSFLSDQCDTRKRVESFLSRFLLSLVFSFSGVPVANEFVFR